MTNAEPHAIGQDEVHAWVGSLELAPRELGRARSVLSNDERNRADRLRRGRDRARFIAARGTLRRVLGAYLGQPAADLRFTYGAAGRPTLADAGSGSAARLAGGLGSGARTEAVDLRFNLAHCHDTLLLGIARGRAVGVDVEHVRSLPHREAIERRVFSAGEQRILAELPDERRLRAFYTGWTRKEAFAKATGVGMWAAIGRIEVALDPDARPALVSLDGSSEAAAGWTVFELRPAPGFIGAIVAEGRGIRLSTRPLLSGAGALR